MDPYDDWDGDPPRLRRPGVRAAVALIAIAAFLGVTLLSTCAPRVSRPSPTTTTQPGFTA